jgi:hypothetical protein
VPVRFVDLRAQHAPLGDALDQAVHQLVFAELTETPIDDVADGVIDRAR